MGNNQPINNVEIERSLLAQLINEPEKLILVNELLKPSHFYKWEHNVIYSSMVELQANNIKYDLAIIAQYLDKTGQLKRIGGTYFIADLFNEGSHSYEVVLKATIIIEYYLRRRALQLGRVIEYNSQNIEVDIFETLSLIISDTEELLNIKDTGDNLILPKNIKLLLQENIIKYQENIIVGMPTPNYHINKYLRGGAQPGNIVVIAGRPSSGKTSYAIDWARTVAKSFPVGIYSIEQTSEEIAMRLMANWTGISNQRILGQYGKKLTTDDNDKIKQYYENPNNSNIYINDKERWNSDDLRIDIKKNVRRFKWKIVFIDYLQLIRASQSSDNRARQVGFIIEDMKAIAKETKIPIVLLSQLNRQVEQRQKKRPELGDMKESGYIEETADVVLTLYNRWKNNIQTYSNGLPTEGQTEIIILKNREGAIGSEIVEYKESIYRFSTLSQQYEPPPITEQEPF